MILRLGFKLCWARPLARSAIRPCASPATSQAAQGKFFLNQTKGVKHEDDGQNCGYRGSHNNAPS